MKMSKIEKKLLVLDLKEIFTKEETIEYLKLNKELNELIKK